MIPIHDIRFFLILVKAGSLAAAAREINVTPPAITQRLQQLEIRLGVRLLDRSTRSMRLTDEGELLLEKGTAICAENDILFEQLSARRAVVAGHLRINAPLGFGRRYIAPLVAQFQTTFPEVKISLTLFDRFTSSAAHNADVTFHIGALTDSSLVAYKIAENARILCAAPAYIRRMGMPSDPESLSQHHCLVLRENNEDVSLWRFSKGRIHQSVRVDPILACNDGEVIHQWALLAKGIMIRSEWDVAENVRGGRLTELLPEWDIPSADVIALVPQRRGMSARVKKFIEYVVEEFAPLPPWRIKK
ncbi:LysR family transcriptional regulator [Glaciimonas sp. PCH181]|uniref:LysR family transcriptional regulator n=1 Tax=Glaciimonas sp. PCH181 TaxID=2133943 RepID=UPI000D34D90B|nr:LysR family transcriptional regulator [Glaciimonas sp. PCH181]PUA18705.1 LysR family transcriptional regulator [Glaciimonas sp. PCH181]